VSCCVESRFEELVSRFRGVDLQNGKEETPFENFEFPLQPFTYDETCD
jgi:hypothetical protein